MFGSSVPERNGSASGKREASAAAGESATNLIAAAVMKLEHFDAGLYAVSRYQEDQRGLIIDATVTDLYGRWHDREPKACRHSRGVARSDPRHEEIERGHEREASRCADQRNEHEAHSEGTDHPGSRIHSCQAADRLTERRPFRGRDSIYDRQQEPSENRGWAR